MTDGQGETVSATINISIVGINDAPVAVDDSYSTHEDVVLSVVPTGVLTNDFDVDIGAVLSVSAILVDTDLTQSSLI